MRAAWQRPRPDRGRRGPVICAVSALVTLLCGCGGGAAGASRATKPTGDLEGGRLFASACSSCHTLDGRESARTSGGDLALTRMTRSEIASFVRVMPQPRPLSQAEQSALSAYVASAQARLVRR